MNIETERKFLIVLPPLSPIMSENGCRVLQIKQTYLCEREKGVERRVRMIKENGETKYVYTEKIHLSGISREERECEVDSEKYRSLLAEAYSELDKTRYAFPFGGHTVEIDVYPYEIGRDALDGYAVLEVELEKEDEEISLPEYITLVRELTGTREFSNKAMAKRI